jgi:arylsulfatase
MKKWLYVSLVLILALSLIEASIIFGNRSDRMDVKHPNIIYILADDLGYNELGCYGQTKIKTPHIDALAESGMRFTQHYSGSSVCAPSRGSLLTGLHTGHAYIRNNGLFKGSSEGQRPLKSGTFTLAHLMKKANYATCCVGKWGLGYPGSEGDPLNMGFDHFFGYNCQTHAHNYYPTYLWRNTDKIILDNPAFPSKQKLPSNVDAYDEKNYAKYQGREHSSDLMGKEVLTFIEQHKEEPFFIYYATPIPHVSLQIPDRDLEEYKNLFEEIPYNGKRGYLPHRYPHAAYAAMISHLDRQVGQIVDKLKKEGLYDNTLIIFTSDNGSADNGGADLKFFNGVGELNGYKGSFYEGGIRVPMIASWPGHIQAGSLSHHVSAFWDVMPTFAELTGQPMPEVDGVSYLPSLMGQNNKQKQHDHLYWELGKSQAVRMGNWKGIRKWKDGVPGKTSLYNLESDLGEQNNLASQKPEIVEEIETIMDSRTPSEVRNWNLGVLEQKSTE